MTREEAIQWLIKPVVTSTEVSETKAKELEAYNMAIESLSVEATDLISREDVLKLIGIVYGDVKMETDERIKLYSEVCELPSADVEWIPCDTSDMPPEGEAVLMSDGNRIWIDETVAWWGDRSDWIGTAWMPLPKPYKGDDTG